MLLEEEEERKKEAAAEGEPTKVRTDAKPRD